jgi:hypothetical protein
MMNGLDKAKVFAEMGSKTGSAPAGHVEMVEIWFYYWEATRESRKML